MAISKETVEYAAHLARISLTQKELDVLAPQLEDILRFIDNLKKVDISKVEPTSHILPIKNVLRQDAPEASLSADEVLKNAPHAQDGFFVVPKVIEE